LAEPLTLMTVHAHPDDEAISTGGVLAKYVQEGVRTVLVTCTRGEVGEISDPALATPENLAEVRTRELEEACRILNVTHQEYLGYRDSGMMGTPENDDPRSFYQADLEEATGRMVALVRRYRPQVLVTYDANGFYGHPDHIRANQVTVGAFARAGDPSAYPEQGLAPWTPLKLYYTAIPRSAFVEMGRRLTEAGIEFPAEERESAPPGTPDELVTTFVDTSTEVEAKRAALLAHRTQMNPEFFWMKIGPEIFNEVFGRETFQRVESRVPAPDREDDLFAGLR
jgi:N-acetyl-1-D-myo-inositol-2-amino-2-deoxy-alpha-D-glucopyranoside deacetylase